MSKKYLFGLHGVYFLLFFSLVSFFSCGRKPRNIFSFKKEQQEFQVNVLSLPTVKNLSIKQEDNKNILVWDKIIKTSINLGFEQPKEVDVEKSKYKVKLLGYNVYRFARSAFVPLEPLNSRPIPENSFEDKKFKKNIFCYLVKGVFQFSNSELGEEKNFEGPASQIVGLK